MRPDDYGERSLNRFLLASVLIHALLLLFFPSWLQEMLSGASLERGGVIEVINITPQTRPAQSAAAPRMPQTVRPPAEERPRPQAQPGPAPQPQPQPVQVTGPEAPERPEPRQPPAPPQPEPVPVQPVERAPEAVPQPAPQQPPTPASPPSPPEPAPVPLERVASRPEVEPAPQPADIVVSPASPVQVPVPAAAPEPRPVPAAVEPAPQPPTTVQPAPAPAPAAPAPPVPRPTVEPVPAPAPVRTPEPVPAGPPVVRPEPSRIQREPTAAAEASAPPLPVPVDDRAMVVEPAPEPVAGTGVADEGPEEEAVPAVRGRDMVAFGGELIYPKTAQDRGYTGTVVVEITVEGATGRARDVRLAQGSGQDVLDQAALLYLTHRATFERASSDYVLEVEVTFRRSPRSGGQTAYEVDIVARDRVVFLP